MAGHDDVGYCAAALMPRMRPMSKTLPLCSLSAASNSFGVPGLTTCPVAALETWMKFGKISRGPLFRKILPDGKTRMLERWEIDPVTLVPGMLSVLKDLKLLGGGR